MASDFLSSDIRKGSDFIDDDIDLCQPCSVDDKRIAATTFCSDCDALLCQRCTAHHAALKSTNDHLLVKADHAKKIAQVVSKDKCSKRCIVHKGKVVNYFCHSHCHFGCSVCITNELKECKAVEHIPTASTDIRGHEGFKTFNSSLNDLEAAYNECMADVTTSLQNIQTDDLHIKDVFKTYRKEFNDALDKMENKTLAQTKKIKTAETRELETLLKELKKQQETVKTLMKEVGDLLSRSKNCDLYVLVHTGVHQLESFQDALASTTRDKTYQHYAFKPNNEVLHGGSLGKLKTRPVSVISNSRSTVAQAAKPPVPARKSSAQGVKQPPQAGRSLVPTAARSSVPAVKPRTPHDGAGKPRDGPTMAAMMKPGVRVRRGKNWCGGDVDRGPGGQGTVIAARGGAYRVHRDADGTYAYRMGADGCYQARVQKF